MSKKLIAVAAAAALVLTGLVATPANASISITYRTAATAGDIDSNTVNPSTSLTAETAATALIAVPANNALEYTATTARNSLMKVTVNSTVAGQVVSAVSDGAIKIVDAPTNTTDKKYTSASGSQNYSVTADSTTVVFYVFTTSTSAGKLTVSSNGNSSVVYIKGAHGVAYNITSALPTVIPAGNPTDNNLIAKITDVFGNTVTSTVDITTSVTGAGGNITATGDATYSSTEGGHGLKLYATGSGGMAVSLGLTDTVTNVTGLAKAVTLWYATSSAADLAGQVATLSAQVAALTAQLAVSRPKANSVTKKRWNALVRAHRALGGSAKLK